MIASASGLHARPASRLTRAVGRSGKTITIGRPGTDPVDATSILSVMSLGIRKDEEVVLTSADDDTDQLLDELVSLLTTDLDHA